MLPGELILAPDTSILQPPEDIVPTLTDIPRGQTLLRIQIGPGVIQHRDAPCVIFADLEDGPAHEALLLDAAEHRHGHLVRGHPAVRLRVDVLHLLGVLLPQRRADDARGDGADADPVALVQRREAAHEPVHRELGRPVDGRAEVGHLARHRPNVHDPLGVRRRGPRLRLPVCCWWWVQPVREGQLRRADGVRQVDVQEGVAARLAVGGVPALGAARRVPEVGPVGLVDTGPWTDDVDGPELPDGHVEHVGQGRPRRHVRLGEDGPWALAGVAVLCDELLGIGPEGEVCEDDIAAARQKQSCKGEVDSCAFMSARFMLSGIGERLRTRASPCDDGGLASHAEGSRVGGGHNIEDIAASF